MVRQNTDSLITVENLSFGYTREKMVLQNMSFALNRGETVAIVGASGCGKSTLLKIMAGILSSQTNNIFEGSIVIDGTSPLEFRNQGNLAFMFQEATLMPNLTVEENIQFPLILQDQRDTGHTDTIIDKVGLNDFKTFLPNSLSGGMKTRVSLARSFITKPSLLLLDEPFSALDISWKSKLYVELENLKRDNGTTVVMVSHDVQESLLLADHVIVLNAGGKIELMKTMPTDIKQIERLKDISNYIDSVFHDFMKPVQDAIIYGQAQYNEK